MQSGIVSFLAWTSKMRVLDPRLGMDSFSLSGNVYFVGCGEG
jgi:hypothetical protein